MNFRFLHIADAHVGGRFAGLARRSERAAAEMARACLDALDAAVDAALEREVAFVVVAGDLFDKAAPDLRDSFEAAARLARLWRAGIDVYWLLGNHDYGPAAEALPSSERLHRFSTRKVETFLREDLGVALHGRSFPERAAPENFAAAYPRAEPGRFEIGVLHTSLDGRAGAATYAPCKLGDLTATGYAYWALGHVHDQEIVARAPHVVFPGCLQGRNPRETGPKGCVAVSVEDGRVLDVEPIVCDRARWLTAATELGDDASSLEAATLDAIEDARDRAEGRFAVIRLRHRAAGAALAALRRKGLSALVEDAARLGLSVGDDIAVEAVRIDAVEAAAPLGLAAEAADLIEEAAADPSVRAALAAARDEIRGKSGAAVDFGDPALDLEAILSAARQLALADADAEPPG